MNLLGTLSCFHPVLGAHLVCNHLTQFQELRLEKMGSPGFPLVFLTRMSAALAQQLS